MGKSKDEGKNKTRMTATFEDILRAMEVSKGTISLDAITDGFEKPDESIFPTVRDTFDRYGWEKMFHHLPQEQLEVLVCLFLGLKPAEIVKVLHYPNIVRYYNVSTKLRKIYQERKEACLDYN